VSYLLEWHNFIFALPLAVGLLLSIAIAFSGFGPSGEATQSDEHGAPDTVEDADNDPSPAHNPHGSMLGALGGWFGLGKGASLTLLLPILLSTWGLVGLLVNTALDSWLPPAVFFPIAAILGLLGAGLAGNGVASVVQNLLRQEGRNVRKQDLVGCGGRAAFRIDGSGGVANIRDKTGNIHRVVCKTLPGEPPIDGGTEILVVDFDPSQGTYFVQVHPFPEEVAARP
jgi:membrane protein implicated in regulation of membrane protease activity